MVLEKLDIHVQKYKIEALSYTIHKNQLKLGQNLKCKTWNHRAPERKHRGKPSWCWSCQWFLHQNIKSTGNKGRKRQVILHQAKKLCTAKEAINRTHRSTFHLVDWQPMDWGKLFANHRQSQLMKGFRPMTYYVICHTYENSYYLKNRSIDDIAGKLETLYIVDRIVN